MQNARLLARARQINNALQNRFSRILQVDPSLDASRVADSLLPVSQLYGFEMRYLHSRKHHEK